MPKLQKESDILNVEFRKKVIKEMMTAQDVLERKQDYFRRHEVYKDQNRKWVIASLENEGYKPETLAQMTNRASDISICRKVINKLAQAYSGGVVRKAETASDQKAIDSFAEQMDFDTAMQKADRYRQLFKNVTIAVLPTKVSTILDDEKDAKDSFTLKVKVFAPYKYDVIEDPKNPEKALVYIFSDFVEQNQVAQAGDVNGSKGVRSAEMVRAGDGKDQIVADSPADKGLKNREFIWWSPNFHFTTDEKGELVSAKSPKDNKNPIGMLPAVDVQEDQDESYWAEGGSDVPNTSVLLNKQITDLNYLSFAQGWGQLVITGKDIPKKLEGGPDNAWCLEDDGTVKPNVFYAQADVKYEGWMRNIEMQLALLLSTNNISVRSVAGSLQVTNVAAGIVLIIENAEVLTDWKDARNKFRVAEPKLWEIVKRWQKVYNETSSLIPEMQELPLISKSKVSLTFPEMKPPITKKEQLEEMKLRKEMGVATQLDLIKIDNPDLSDEDAKKKLAEIEEEKKKNAEQFGVEGDPAADGEEDEPEENEKGKEGEENVAPNKKPQASKAVPNAD